MIDKVIGLDLGRNTPDRTRLALRRLNPLLEQIAFSTDPEWGQQLARLAVEQARREDAAIR